MHPDLFNYALGFGEPSVSDLRIRHQGHSSFPLLLVFLSNFSFLGLIALEDASD